jgi:3-isopropylmalate dehydrogenase
MSHHVLLLPGDGIGPEVVAQARRVLDAVAARFELVVALDEANLGGVAIDREGTAYPESTRAKARAADAILLGAVGGPKWDGLSAGDRPERGLLAIRADLDLFANLRPAMLFPQLAAASSLKAELVAGLDILIVRELTGGIYFGEPRGIRTRDDGQREGFNTYVYSESEIERIARLAFELAGKRGGRVTSVDKANVLEVTQLWREIVSGLACDYPDVALEHMYVDNAAMQLVRAPKQFDVLVTGNIFGDILSDTAAMLTGSLGMLPSASLGAVDETTGKRHALYEPVHGSAPDIAGKGLANPLAEVLSFSMLLRYSFDQGDDADLIEKAVEKALEGELRTGDIMTEGCTPTGTDGMIDQVIRSLDELSR